MALRHQYSVDVVLKHQGAADDEDADPADAETIDAELRQVLSAFVRALELGLFEGGVVHAWSEVSSPTSGGLAFSLEAQDVPAHAWTVLAGMIAHLGEVWFGLDSCAIRDATAQQNLMFALAPLPGLPDKLPKHIELERSHQRIAPELGVRVEFAAQEGTFESAGVLAEALEVWGALLHGGYSASDQLGDAGVGAVTQGFVDPWTLRYSAETWRGGSACLVPLLTLVRRWQSDHPVSRVEVVMA